MSVLRALEAGDLLFIADFMVGQCDMIVIEAFVFYRYPEPSRRSKAFLFDSSIKWEPPETIFRRYW